MTDRRQPTDTQIAAALRARLPGQAPTDLHARIATRVVATSQARHFLWLPGLGDAPALARLATAVAAVAVVAIAGLNLLGGSGIGGAPAPAPVPEGPLRPGRYVARPLPPPDDGLTVTFTVPEGWEALVDAGGRGLSLVPSGPPGTKAPGGISLQVIDVTSLNDPCHWSGTTDDVPVGPGVADLVEALQSQTAYDVSDARDVTIGGYSGQRVDIVMPTGPFAGETSAALECDETHFLLWSTTAHGPGGVYAQGPANRWQTIILDVAGTRLVIVAADFPGTLPDDRAQLDAIVDSLVIEP